MPTPPRIFIGYSHDSNPHAERVRGLADRLRADGVDCILDQRAISGSSACTTIASTTTTPPSPWARNGSAAIPTT